MSKPGLSRRRALTGVAGVGIALPVLAACGGEDSAASDTAPTATAGTALAATADIPVGGGAVFSEAGVVVTQPTEGEFKGFSVTCTHSGCPVNQVTSTINCPCHGSKFSLTDGAPEAGPASSPLAPVALTVTGDQITLA